MMSTVPQPPICPPRLGSPPNDGSPPPEGGPPIPCPPPDWRWGASARPTGPSPFCRRCTSIESLLIGPPSANEQVALRKLYARDRICRARHEAVSGCPG